MKKRRYRVVVLDGETIEQAPKRKKQPQVGMLGRTFALALSWKWQYLVGATCFFLGSLILSLEVVWQR